MTEGRTPGCRWSGEHQEMADGQVCKRCGTLKPPSSYTPSSNGRLLPTCKDCYAAKRKERSAAVCRRRGSKAAPKRQRLDPNGMTVEQRKSFVRAVKALNPCVDRGATEQLEFDHLPQYPKLFVISQALTLPGVWDDEALVAEIQKCEVVCRPCHQGRTIQRVRVERDFEDQRVPRIPQTVGLRSETL